MVLVTGLREYTSPGREGSTVATVCPADTRSPTWSRISVIFPAMVG
jgi:ribosomal protein S19